MKYKSVADCDSTFWGTVQSEATHVVHRLCERSEATQSYRHQATVDAQRLDCFSSLELRKDGGRQTTPGLPRSA